MKAPSYQRLSGRSFALSGVASLWIGEGHVLEVVSMMPIERYRRWYLRDVQALVARRSGKRTAWNLAWGIAAGLALALATALLGLAAAQDGQAQIVMRVFAALSGGLALLGAVLVLVNTLFGPTCTVFIHTPQAVIELAAPTRQRGFQRLVAQLRPLLEAEQSFPADQAATSPGR